MLLTNKDVGLPFFKLSLDNLAQLLPSARILEDLLVHLILVKDNICGGVTSRHHVLQVDNLGKNKVIF